MNGDFHIKRSTNVIFTQYDSQWCANASVKALAHTIKQHSQYMPTSGWAFLDDVRNWPVKPPEDIDYCATAVEQLSNLGLTHCVVCHGDLAISRWMMQKIIPDDIELVFYDNLADCYTWLRTQGFDDQFD
jgi:hypothetical protein